MSSSGGPPPRRGGPPPAKQKNIGQTLCSAPAVAPAVTHGVAGWLAGGVPARPVLASAAAAGAAGASVGPAAVASAVVASAAAAPGGVGVPAGPRGLDLVAFADQRAVRANRRGAKACPSAGKLAPIIACCWSYSYYNI